MNTTELAKEIAIWSRWSYSFIKQEIICFTEKIIDFDDKTHMWKITYKPKTWFNRISIKQFRELRKIPELRKNFRWFKNGWFTEEDPGEEAPDGVDSDAMKELFET